MWTRDFEEAGENLQSELPVFNILFCFHEREGGDGYLALVFVFFQGLQGIGADYYYYYYS